MQQRTIDDFLEYMRQHGGNWVDWYVGIAEEPKTRLFSDHNVSEVQDIWIHSSHTGVSAAAREIEDYFLALGCSGGPGGGSDRTCYVYAYKIAPHTNENN